MFHAIIRLFVPGVPPLRFVIATEKWIFASEKIQLLMSALPSKADMCGAARDVRFGPTADSCTAANSILFDYCVDARKDLRGHVEAKRIRRFRINHELVRLHRQISRQMS